jgi:hypothetical protein
MITGVRGHQLAARFTNIVKHVDNYGQKLTIQGKRTLQELILIRNFKRNSSNTIAALDAIENGKIFHSQKVQRSIR